jgi:hypothetical protein
MHRHKAHVRALDECNYDRILDSLKQGPVAIGENHGSKSARVVVLKLIDSGYVKQLFVECMKPAGGSHPISQKDMEMICAFLAPTGENIGDTSIYGVVDAAMKKDIDVYCFDYWTLDKKWMTSDEGMNARDDVMSQTFKKFVKNDGIGALLLNGAAHLSSSSGHYNSGKGSLARKCGIGQIFQFDWDYKKDDPSKRCGEQLLF